MKPSQSPTMSNGQGTKVIGRKLCWIFFCKDLSLFLLRGFFLLAPFSFVLSLAFLVGKVFNLFPERSVIERKRHQLTFESLCQSCPRVDLRSGICWLCLSWETCLLLLLRLCHDPSLVSLELWP